MLPEFFSPEIGIKTREIEQLNESREIVKLEARGR